mmetsp:Transcript_6805/g.17047  ORF Transcript_6805/g.17047 Transcript_6805/m.17047 type:complete len:97 (-) Transcript_6805:2222-2512(-)
MATVVVVMIVIMIVIATRGSSSSSSTFKTPSATNWPRPCTTVRTRLGPAIPNRTRSAASAAVPCRAPDSAAADNTATTKTKTMTKTKMTMTARPVV